MNSTFLDRLTRPAQVLVAFGLVLGLSTAFTASQLVGGEPQNDRGDRGENPVVGSLPCLVNDILDLIFWEGMKENDPGFLPASHPVTLGLCSDDIRGDVIHADGEPFGLLNDRWDWRALGLTQRGRVTFESWKIANGLVSVWMWAPPGYHGGELCMSSSFGERTVRLGKDARELPAADIVQLAGGAVSIANFAIKAPAGSGLPTLRARLTVLGPVTVVEFL
jgi:hypothetical protein